jgi:hypothetical protein
MVSLIIYGIIAIALSAAAGYALLVFTGTSKQATYTGENELRMESAVTALRASILALSPGANGGVLFAPAGSSATYSQGATNYTYSGIPASLGVMSSTPWGVPYLYCPVSLTTTPGLTATATTTVKSPDGTTYSVGTYSSNATANASYVITSSGETFSNISGTSTPSGYIAFVVSPVNPGTLPPDCSAITVNSLGQATVSGGFAASDRAEFYVSTTPTGDQTGRDANNMTTLDYAISLWGSLQPRQMDVYLAGGNTTTTAYNMSQALNAQTIRPFADGETTSLVIGTTPSSGSNAVLVINNGSSTTLNTSLAFENLTIENDGTLTALKPLLLNGVTYQPNTAMNTAVNVYGTTLTVNDSNLTNVQLGLNNATAEFYNRNSNTYTFSNTQITGALAHVSFDSASSGSIITFSGSTSNTASPLQLTGSTLNIGANTTVNISQTNTTTSSNPLQDIANVALMSSVMNVASSATLSIPSGSNTSYGGINALDGSTVDIAGTVSIQPAANAMNYGIYLQGSKLGLEGALSTTNLSLGAIGIRQGELTGNGTIKVTQTNAVPCVRLYQGVADSGGLNATGGSVINSIPLYITPSTATGDSTNTYASANLPSFSQAQYGMPGMVNYLNAVRSGTTYPVAETNAASLLGNTNNPINDPQVAVNITAVPAVTTFYVDPTTLERAVRNLVNAEFMSGTNLNFAGSCTN